MASKKVGRLSRPEIDLIVDGMSAGDIFRATAGETAPNLTAEAIFNGSAARQGYGENAIDRVKISDAQYLGELLGETLNMGSLEAGDTEASPTSAATGDSAQS